MPSTDDDLLARLNALKQTPINLSTSKSVLSTRPDAIPDITSDLAEPDSDPIIDLAARFKALGNPGKEKAKANQRRVAQPLGADGDDIEIETAFTGGSRDCDDEKTLEELLRELGPGDSQEWMVGRGEAQDLGKLVEEARRVIPDVPRLQPGRKGGNIGEMEETGGSDGEDSEEHEDEQDERDADEYVAKVLAELEMDQKYGGEEDGIGEDEEHAEEDSKGHMDTSSDIQPDSSQTPLSLPSAPSTQPVDTPTKEDIDNALTARLNALSLPSAPSFALSKKPTKVTKSLPKFTDDEIESWCIICNDDATLKCTGCDGDLYCRSCWKEGHTGESAGYEERMHRTRKYEKKS
ncbi:hypothetical protein EJ05DRAFT_70699 [Pseudovirgaria hyperparasitica]|uniref:Uncharacterized protein n=1 Tax=Pseudovirgaria hyperparasitica TaxID=470096 RepID=A0A6A6W3W1_9PEZI|nr:uncharacterized protein EJ05DRAFT_70699 [Pseudovirgaria hyperparasitica]KAF2756630.1 hypothetical protein EJ05DRAFT_70699 [Pseudovirgaria hyperparasitica]